MKKTESEREILLERNVFDAESRQMKEKQRIATLL